MGCNGLQWDDFLRNYYPLTKIVMEEWAAMGCNGKTFEELPPTKSDMQAWAAMGCNGRTLRNELPWLKLPCKSGLHWAARGEFLRNDRPPDWNSQVGVGCTGLQAEEFWGLTLWIKLAWRVGAVGCNGRTLEELPPFWNSQARVGCNGQKREHFEELPPPD